VTTSLFVREQRSNLQIRITLDVIYVRHHLYQGVENSLPSTFGQNQLLTGSDAAASEFFLDIDVDQELLEKTAKKPRFWNV
jgi:hypothetical protein